MRHVTPRRAWVCGLAFAAATAIACLPGAAAAQDRPVEIRVDAPAAQNLGSWPLGVGVPMPRVRMKSGDTIRLRGEKQGTIPVQVSEKTRWPDGSVQWTWLDEDLRGAGRARSVELQKP